MFVYVGVLLDVGVGPRQVGFRLVVVVVADEVLDGVGGEELLELRRELGRQRLVVGNHQRGALDPLHDAGHGEGFAAAGDAHERLMAYAVLDGLRQPVDGLGLIARGLEL